MTVSWMAGCTVQGTEKIDMHTLQDLKMTVMDEHDHLAPVHSCRTAYHTQADQDQLQGA